MRLYKFFFCFKYAQIKLKQKEDDKIVNSVTSKYKLKNLNKLKKRRNFYCKVFAFK